MPLELIASRLSRNPAQLFQLKDRGEIAEGKYADLCIFDIDKLRDQSTFVNPLQQATGMTHVLVNGKFALYNGEITGTLAGRALYRNR